MPNDEGPQTPPLSSNNDKVMSSPTAHSDKGDPQDVSNPQSILSPLTLGELGLNPPSSPGALLDITTPVSLDHEEPSGIVQLVSQQVQHADSGGKGNSSQTVIAANRRSELDAKADNFLSGRPSSALAPASIASPAGFQDPFLTSFLESLSEDPFKTQDQSTDHPTAVTTAAPMNCTFNSTDNQSESAFGHTATLIRADQATARTSSADMTSAVACKPPLVGVSGAEMPQMTSQATESVQNQPLPASTTASDYCHPYWITSQQLPPSLLSSQSLSFSIGQHSTSAPLESQEATTRNPFLPLVPENFLVTSTTLQQARLGNIADPRRGENAQPISAAPVSLSVETPTTSSTFTKTKGRLDLAHIADYSLPPAPPLQVELARKDCRYRLESEEDGKSSSRNRNNVGCDSKDGRAVFSGVSSDRWRGKPSAEKLPGSVATALSQLSGTGVRGASDTLRVTRTPLQKVPLSSVVRPRSWSNASQTAASHPQATAWFSRSMEVIKELESARPATCAQTTQFEQSETDKPSGCSTTSSFPALTPSTPASQTFTAVQSSREASHDFTRQALLDFIKRTNLGMVSSRAAGLDATPPNPNTLATSPGISTGREALGKVSWEHPSAWFSRVSVEPRADTQSWQHQRKRQKVRGDADGETGTGKTSSISIDCTSSAEVPSNDVKDGTSVQPPRLNKRSATLSEQEQKSKKQAQYQRLLQQLQAQMRLKMQMQKQKQREMQEQMERSDASEQMDKNKDRAEALQSSPPSKTARAGCSETTGSSAQGSASTEGVTHNDDDSVFVKPSAVTRSGKRNDDRTKAHGSHSSSHTKRRGSREDSSQWKSGSTPRAAACNIPGSQAADSSPATYSASDTIFREPSPIKAARAAPQCPTYEKSFWPATMPSGLVAANPASMWKSGQHSWCNNIGVAGQANFGSVPRPSPATCLPSWLDTSSTSIATDLITKHLNWLRAMDTPSLVPIVSPPINFEHNSRPPHMRDASPLSISAASGLTAASTNDSQSRRTSNGMRMNAAEGPRIKRPFSPGEEVVFWAVKGEHSVRLVGTVESVSLVPHPVFRTSSEFARSSSDALSAVPTSTKLSSYLPDIC